jgi:hypothetical protein
LVGKHDSLPLKQGIGWDAMTKPGTERDTAKQDLFWFRHDHVADIKRGLGRQAQTIDWPVLEARFGAVCSDGAGIQPQPIPLTAGIAILKHKRSTCRMRRCAPPGLKTPASNTFAAKGFSVTNCRNWSNDPTGVSNWEKDVPELVHPSDKVTSRDSNMDIEEPSSNTVRLSV